VSMFDIMEERVTLVRQKQDAGCHK
jgi:hypothetical protein